MLIGYLFECKLWYKYNDGYGRRCCCRVVPLEVSVGLKLGLAGKDACSRPALALDVVDVADEVNGALPCRNLASLASMAAIFAFVLFSQSTPSVMGPCCLCVHLRCGHLPLWLLCVFGETQLRRLDRLGIICRSPISSMRTYSSLSDPVRV